MLCKDTKLLRIFVSKSHRFGMTKLLLEYPEDINTGQYQ